MRPFRELLQQHQAPFKEPNRLLETLDDLPGALTVKSPASSAIDRDQCLARFRISILRVRGLGFRDLGFRAKSTE